jgi:predicted MPP superfamily phosphohydrolase
MQGQWLSRRGFLAGTGALGAAVVLDAFALEPNWLEVTCHDVPVEGLPRELDGFSVLQVTDAHLKGFGAVEQAVVRALHSHDVQLVVLTGDILDSAESLSSLREFAAALRKPGTEGVATLGNWEHWGRVPLAELATAYGDNGIKLLVNEAKVLAEGVRIFATDDCMGGSPRLRELRDPRALATLLLTHSPVLLDEAAFSAGTFSLALSGHTHGGQVRLGRDRIPFLPSGCGRFVAGWYKTPGGRAYVSRGTGTSVIPARFTCRPELPIVRLRQG